MVIKYWWCGLKDILKEYTETGEVTIEKSYYQPTKGGFGWFSFIISAMLVMLPFALIVTLMQLPVMLVGELVLLLYKLSKGVRHD